jgi:hypothetical protein
MRPLVVQNFRCGFLHPTRMPIDQSLAYEAHNADRGLRGYACSHPGGATSLFCPFFRLSYVRSLLSRYWNFWHKSECSRFYVNPRLEDKYLLSPCSAVITDHQAGR